MSLRDLRRLVVIQSPVKDHQLMLVRESRKLYNHNNNNYYYYYYYYFNLKIRSTDELYSKTKFGQYHAIESLSTPTA